MGTEMVMVMGTENGVFQIGLSMPLFFPCLTAFPFWYRKQWDVFQIKYATVFPLSVRFSFLAQKTV